MSKKEGFILGELNTILFAMVFSFVAQLINGGKIELSGIPIPFFIGIFLGTVISLVVPVGNWGGAVALKIGAKPGSFAFDAVFCFVVAAVMATIMDFLMNIIMGCIINKAPLGAMLVAALTTLHWYIIVAYIVVLVTNKPISALAHKIAGEKVC